MDEVRCRSCQRVLTDAESIARGQGPQCAGLARARCGHIVSDMQLSLAWDTFPYATTPFRDWPWVKSHREARAGDPRHVDGCDGCDDFGVCGWHATTPEAVALYRSFGVGRKRAVPTDAVVTEAR